MFVIGTMQVGGSELHLRMIASALVKRGWRVSLCSLSGDGPLRHEFERDGVTVYIPPVDRNNNMNIVTRFAKLAIAASYLLALFLRRRTKIVHFFLPQAYLTGAPLALLAQVPVRIMSRRSLNVYQVSHPILREAERLCHKTMAAILGNSLGVIKDLRDEGVPDDKLGAIYNGIDLRRFRQLKSKEELRQSLGIGPERLVLAIVANLIPYKGHGDLLEALAIARPRLPRDWHLLIVGRDDGIGQELRRRASELAIEDHVSFLGSRSDIPELLGASDIGLSCSHEEGFSNAVLEGMAIGLPMIVTRVGGNPEAIDDGATGFVVPPRDPVSLADAIVRLGKDPGLRATFGHAGKNRVATEYSLDHCVEQYEALYLALLEGRRPMDVPGIGLTASDESTPTADTASTK